ncbi:MAG: stage II sporulation protein M [Steroidobacteraceae bacterium]
MTPLQFETRHRSQWQRCAEQLGELQRLGAQRARHRQLAAALTVNYLECCEQLALARSRGYPAYIVEPLEQLTYDAHRLIYRRHEWGLGRLRLLALRDFPRQVRALRLQVLLAALAFGVPMLLVGALIYWRPDLIGSVYSTRGAAELEEMYSSSAEALGRTRSAGTDWTMFGYYIRNNIGIAFQCFAGGVFLGFGSLFYLIVNGAIIGAVAGYVTARGLGGNFYPFIATHSAFELTAIVLAGAAGLRMGAALLAPGRLSRGQALVQAGREAVVVVYGVIALLLLAAALEAFWSSSLWLPVSVKFAVASLAWVLVIGYLVRQARDAD